MDIVNEYRDVRMDLMGSRDVQRYLKERDMVILPVGCFEMHGPVMPLGCDSFHAWGQALILAKEWECLTLPPVFYTFPGASGPWPGTVEISNRVTIEYIKAIVLSLIKTGFKRIVLCGTHGPLKFTLNCLLRDIFMETNIIVFFIAPQMMPEDLMQEKLGYLRGEDILLAASFKILGMHGVYDPSSKVDMPIEFPFNTNSDLSKANVSVPWTFSRDYQHTGLRKKVTLADVDKAIDVMKEAAARLKNIPETFSKYQEEMKDLWTRAPWKDPDVWTETR